MPLRVGRILLRVGACVVLGALTTIVIAWGVALRGIDERAARVSKTATRSALVLPGATEAWVMDAPTNGFGWRGMTVQRWRIGEVGTSLVSVSQTMRTGEFYVVCQRALDYPTPWHPPGESAHSRFELQFGWPMAATWAAQDEITNSNPPTALDRVLGNRHTLEIPQAHASAWERSHTYAPMSRTVVVHAPKFCVLDNPFLRDVGSLRNWPAAKAVPLGVVPIGFGVNSMLFACMWGGLAFGIGGLVRRKRGSRGRCASCGYELRGLAAGAVCPECGKASEMAGEHKVA